MTASKKSDRPKQYSHEKKHKIAGCLSSLKKIINAALRLLRRWPLSV